MASDGREIGTPQDYNDDGPEPNVFCNVYDILPRLNVATSYCQPSWGIYHTGVQVHGLEFSYGGHADSSTGVFCAKPWSAQGCQFREQVPIGRTALDPIELRRLIAEISAEWPGNAYDPFKRNCNHFADFLSLRLTGNNAPPYVNKFTGTCFVKSVFYNCVLPLGRCVQRFYEYGGITYSNADAGTEESTESTGISGARGINQVLVEAATVQKVNANKLFKEGSFDEAKKAYEKALTYLSTLCRRTEEEDEIAEQGRQVQLALFLNVAACELKVGNYERVVERCSSALDIDQKSQKAMYRMGVAQGKLGKNDDALANLRQALNLTAETDTGTLRDIRREIDVVKKNVEGERNRDKEFAKRMFAAG